MTGDFSELATVQFQKAMRPHAEAIYQRIWPGCVVEDLREKGVKVHILDQEFGIDSLVHFPTSQWVSIQEKYRANDALKYLDFTQEYMNAEGTSYEAPGEWFKLGAQLYFYGWANADGTGFEKWAILNIPKYKMLVEAAGGLQALGKKRVNKRHGRASFFAIPIHALEPAFVTDYREWPQAAPAAARAGDYRCALCGLPTEELIGAAGWCVECKMAAGNNGGPHATPTPTD